MSSKHKHEVNQEKIAQLKKNAELLKKVGAGRGVRRKNVVVKKSEDSSSKHQQVLRKLNASLIPEIDEVNFFLDNDTVKNFAKPKVYAAIQSNAFVISGSNQDKTVAELLPQLLEQLNPNELGKFEEFTKLLENQGGDLPSVESFDQTA